MEYRSIKKMALNEQEIEILVNICSRIHLFIFKEIHQSGLNKDENVLYINIIVNILVSTIMHAPEEHRETFCSTIIEAVLDCFAARKLEEVEAE